MMHFTVDHPEWMERAACHDIGDMFYVDTNDESSLALAAKRVCASCPVRIDCLAYAVDNKERFGIWGGLTATERQRMHKRENKNSTIDRVEIERTVETLLFNNQMGHKAYQKLNSFEKAIVHRILVHDHGWTQTMLGRHLRMNGASANHRYHVALDSGAINLLKEIA